jgi:hypothetical protein
MSYIIYLIYNLIFEGITIFFLLYSSVYLNGWIIPDKYLWNENGIMRSDLITYKAINIVILLIEIILLSFILTWINKLYLAKVAKSSISQSIKIWTLIAYLIANIFILIYTSYPNLK